VLGGDRAAHETSYAQSGENTGQVWEASTAVDEDCWG
jgi:hypothetical protein